MNGMNSIQVVNGQQVTIANNGIANVVASHSGGHTVHTVHTHMTMEDEDDDDDDQDDSFGEDDMMVGNDNDVTHQLAAAGWQHGPVGVAAAAAIQSAKRRKKSHTFETNPSIRKRQQTRLLRKLKATIEEFALRVGQQAVILVATPGKPANNFRAFGAKPLEDVIKNLKTVIMSELETALSQQAPAPQIEDPSLHELPPIVIEGIPTPVEKMTQAQLRAFIPLMLKYSTGRGKPGWGKESTKPAWWPKGVPWANVRMDARTEEDKAKQISWTHALREIVMNCYKYHGREDLLPVFNEEEEVVKRGLSPRKVGHYPGQTVVQTISNPDGTVSILHVDPNNPVIQLPDGTTAQVRINSEGTQLISLPDGTTAQVQGVAHVHEGAGVHTLAEVATSEHLSEISGTTEIHTTEHGHIIITGEDGQSYPVQVSGHQLVTVPVPASMYQTVVANLQAGGEPGHHVQVVGSHGIQLAGHGGRGTPIQLTGLGGGMQGIVMKQEPGESQQGLTITPVSMAGAHHVSVLQMAPASEVSSSSQGAVALVSSGERRSADNRDTTPDTTA